MIDLYKKCNLCPRKYSIDRTKTLGYCKATDKVIDFQIYLNLLYIYDTMDM